MTIKLKNWNYNIFDIPYGKDINIAVLDNEGIIHFCLVNVWEEFDRSLDQYGNAEVNKHFQIRSLAHQEFQNKVNAIKNISEVNVICWRLLK